MHEPPNEEAVRVPCSLDYLVDQKGSYAKTRRVIDKKEGGVNKQAYLRFRNLLGHISIALKLIFSVLDHFDRHLCYYLVAGKVVSSLGTFVALGVGKSGWIRNSTIHRLVDE